MSSSPAVTATRTGLSSRSTQTRVRSTAARRPLRWLVVLAGA